MYQIEKPENKDPKAILHTTKGEIKIRLFPEKAPKTVDNFVELSKNSYYDGVIFHRVIENFMIQSGDPTGTGRGGQSKWGQSFDDEISDLLNLRGALSMANSGPNTNGSQFFIVQMDRYDDSTKDILMNAPMAEDKKDAYLRYCGAFWLDNKHTVFGQVYEGLDIVDEIASVATDAMDKPYEEIIIEKIEIQGL
ncbi:MAG: peptidylprolyl isomerase [Tissierellia bacterium]|nr:peptidylprolyl isomerase [Tissierellia bacterium]